MLIVKVLIWLLCLVVVILSFWQGSGGMLKSCVIFWCFLILMSRILWLFVVSVSVSVVVIVDFLVLFLLVIRCSWIFDKCDGQLMELLLLDMVVIMVCQFDGLVIFLGYWVEWSGFSLIDKFVL